MNYNTEIIKYKVYFTDARGVARNKMCYTIEQTYASAKQIKELGGSNIRIQQINAIIFEEL